MAIADSSYFFIQPKPFLRPTTKLKGLQPPAGTDPGHIDFKHLVFATWPPWQLLTASSFFTLPNPFFRPKTKLKDLQPRQGQILATRLQTPCLCHLTTVAIAGSSYFFIQPKPFLRPTTKLKGLQPPAGTDPGHIDFKHPVFATWPPWELLTAPSFLLCLILFPPYNEAKRPPATARGTSHLDFKHFAFTTWPLCQLPTAPTVIFCLSLFSALQRS